MAQLFPNCLPYRNTNGQQTLESLSRSLSLKLDSTPQLHHSLRPVCFQIQDKDSSSSQSAHSNHDFTATACTNSKDQCLSSESGQEISCEKNLGGHANPVYLMGYPDAAFNATQIDFSQKMTCVPYPSADPYYNGFVTAYGPAPFVMMGVTTGRIPLPLDISEDEPIYVNAKQYHGILRRRQLRAKMEAQNKLVKIRKPYLHESRHIHALKRVRGSGGRFLSTKKQQQSNSTGRHSIIPSSNINMFSHSNGNNNNMLVFQPHHHHQSQGAETNSTSNGVSFFEQPACTFSTMSSSHTNKASMQRNEGLFLNGSNQHCAPLVQ